MYSIYMVNVIAWTIICLSWISYSSNCHVFWKCSPAPDTANYHFEEAQLPGWQMSECASDPVQSLLGLLKWSGPSSLLSPKIGLKQCSLIGLLWLSQGCSDEQPSMLAERWDFAFRKRMGHIKAWNNHLTFSFLPNLRITGSDVNQGASVSPLCLSLICGPTSSQNTHNFVLVLECLTRAFWISGSVAELGKGVMFGSSKISSLQPSTPISENLPEN